MNNDRKLAEVQKEWHGTLKSYGIGFIASIVLTGVAFLLVAFHVMTGLPLILTIVGLGLIQALIQLRFFMHVGEEPKPRYETLIFLFMVMVLLIIVLGSLWIMHDLNNRMMSI